MDAKTCKANGLSEHPDRCFWVVRYEVKVELKGLQAIDTGCSKAGLRATHHRERQCRPTLCETFAASGMEGLFHEPMTNAAFPDRKACLLRAKCDRYLGSRAGSCSTASAPVPKCGREGTRGA